MKIRNMLTGIAVAAVIAMAGNSASAGDACYFYFKYGFEMWEDECAWEIYRETTGKLYYSD